MGSSSHQVVGLGSSGRGIHGKTRRGYRGRGISGRGQRESRGERREEQAAWRAGTMWTRSRHPHPQHPHSHPPTCRHPMARGWKGDGPRMQAPKPIPSCDKCVMACSFIPKHGVNGSRIPKRNPGSLQMMFLLPSPPSVKPEFLSEYFCGLEDLSGAMGLKAAALRKCLLQWNLCTEMVASG